MPNKLSVMPQLIPTAAGYQVKGKLLYDLIEDLSRRKLSMPDSAAEVVILDCEQLTRIDSAGIAVFIGWQRECEKNNKKLQLLKLPPQATSLIKANKLDVFFTYVS